MAHFRGIIRGQRGNASRLGSKTSGLTVEAASWQGKVTVQLHEVNGVDMVHIQLARHNGAGVSRVLYDGPVSGQHATDLRMLCPRCEGDGEEVGAPIETDGKWLCSVCDGKGDVTVKQAAEYIAEEEASR